jgi:hypothetical protein
MNSELTIVKDLMSKYNLTKKDLFSFCICAVNFLEYYEEEGMGDMMRDCPERYYGADSNNFRAVAGALTGEKKSQRWTDEEQFAYYMESIQGIIYDNLEDGGLDRFLEEYQRFEKVYRREIIVPFMLGCPVEEYDDTRFDDEDYIESIANIDNLTIYKAHKEDEEAEDKAYQEKQEAELAKRVKEKEDDEDFSILLVSRFGVQDIAGIYDNYNHRFYPDRDYKVIPLEYGTMIIQTGGKSLEEVKERILRVVEGSFILLGRKAKKDMVTVEKAFNGSPIPQILKDNKVTHVITYY